MASKHKNGESIIFEISLSYLFVSGKRYLAAMPFESESVTVIPTDFGELIGKLDLKKLPFDPLEYVEHLDQLPFDPDMDPGLGN